MKLKIISICSPHFYRPSDKPGGRISSLPSLLLPPHWFQLTPMPDPDPQAVCACAWAWISNLLGLLLVPRRSLLTSYISENHNDTQPCFLNCLLCPFNLHSADNPRDSDPTFQLSSLQFADLLKLVLQGNNRTTYLHATPTPAPVLESPELSLYFEYLQQTMSIRVYSFKYLRRRHNG